MREPLDEASVYIALHLEDAAPAAIFDKHAGEQMMATSAAGEGEERDEVAQKPVKDGGGFCAR